MELVTTKWTEKSLIEYGRKVFEESVPEIQRFLDKMKNIETIEDLYGAAMLSGFGDSIDLDGSKILGLINSFIEANKEVYGDPKWFLG